MNDVMLQGEDELDQILNRFAQWHAQGHAMALATVVEIGRSAPRIAGSHMLIRADGRFAGSVSGGCVEGDVVIQALQLIENGGGHRLLIYQGANGHVWEIGLPCGNGISILIQTLDELRFSPELLTHVRAQRLQGKTVYVETDLNVGMSRLTEHSASDLFMNIYPPRRRLAIVGAVHIAEMLAPMAYLAGYTVTIIEPRQLFALSLDVGHPVIDEWPDDGIDQWCPDAGSAVVVLTHDPKLDDPALIRALQSPAFYVGALGSRYTQQRRIIRLREAGLTEEHIARLHGPVGLPIGAVGPAEIAISILSEMTAVYRHISVIPPPARN